MKLPNRFHLKSPLLTKLASQSTSTPLTFNLPALTVVEVNPVEPGSVLVVIRFVVFLSYNETLKFKKLNSLVSIPTSTSESNSGSKASFPKVLEVVLD